MEVELTKLSTRGQVVIPIKIRDELGINPGNRFVVYVVDDSIVLKTLNLPSGRTRKLSGKDGG